MFKRIAAFSASLLVSITLSTGLSAYADTRPATATKEGLFKNPNGRRR